MSYLFAIFALIFLFAVLVKPVSIGLINILQVAFDLAKNLFELFGLLLFKSAPYLKKGAVASFKAAKKIKAKPKSKTKMVKPQAKVIEPKVEASDELEISCPTPDGALMVLKPAKGDGFNISYVENGVPTKFFGSTQNNIKLAFKEALIAFKS